MLLIDEDRHEPGYINVPKSSFFSPWEEYILLKHDRMSQSSNVPNTVWVPTADEQVEVLVYRSTRQPYIDPGTRSEWRRPRQVSSAPRVANTDGISENTASLNVQGSSLSPRGEPSSATHYTAEGSNAHISPKATQAVLSREEIVTERLVPPVESVAGPSNPLHKEFKRRSEPRKFFKAGKVRA
ncbi:hypothetical protein K431DRAFT_100996 [Polychaeton citri CBS 116435]|uniref:Uncharacterized protein n=1 Tax=Polychaeton citri CBS 116435 TaxID=1314669 RepID=A0A9P4QDQ0_9PEZI|nr:hypothetical protein K431DRAFT_100996 [Polychaeton citri CBS 116435]